MLRSRGVALLGVAAAILFGSPASALADDSGEPSEVPSAEEARRYHVSVYAAMWGEFNLPAFPYRVVTLDVPLSGPYFVSLGGAYALVPRFDVPLGLFTLSDLALELDGQVLKHFGRQDHVEFSGAFVLRTGTATLGEVLGINFAVGEGLSVATTKPKYEKGPSGKRGVGSRRLQNHLLFELEFTLPAWPFVHAVIRLHHRSGIYGVISPQKTGSNFLGLGLRMDN